MTESMAMIVLSVVSVGLFLAGISLGVCWFVAADLRLSKRANDERDAVFKRARHTIEGLREMGGTARNQAASAIELSLPECMWGPYPEEDDS